MDAMMIIWHPQRKSSSDYDDNCCRYCFVKLTRLRTAHFLNRPYIENIFMRVDLISIFSILIHGRIVIFLNINDWIWKVTSSSYFGSMAVILKSMLWMDVKMFVAPCTTHSRVSGIAMGVHQERKTGSFLEHKGKTPEKWPSTKTTW